MYEIAHEWIRILRVYEGMCVCIRAYMHVQMDGWCMNICLHERLHTRVLLCMFVGPCADDNNPNNPGEICTLLSENMGETHRRTPGRGAAIAVQRVHLCPRLQQQRRRGVEAVPGGPVQRGGPVSGPAVDIRCPQAKSPLRGDIYVIIFLKIFHIFLDTY